MKASIVSVGNELLFGLTVDTNAAWLGRTLSEQGIQVVRRFTVGDVEGEIQNAVSSAMASADVVIVSGGLGPTPDDVTKPAVASLFGRRLVEDEGALSGGQFEIPEGFLALRNSCGTAPGLLLTADGVDVVRLPDSS